MKTPSIEGMVEEFKGMVWHSRLKAFDKATDDEEEKDHNTEMFVGWLRLALTQAHQAGRDEANKSWKEKIKKHFDRKITEALQDNK